MNLLALKAPVFLALGVALGVAYFGALRWNVSLYCGGERIALALSIHILRLLAAAAIFIPVARSGLAPLLSTLAGFQLAKLLAIRARGFSSEATS